MVDLTNVLEREKRDGKAGRLVLSLMRMDLVILDELEYLPFRSADCALLATEPTLDAVKNIELAGAAAALAAMEKKVELDGLNPAQRAVVAARMRQSVVNSIKRGEIPEVRVAEKVEVKRDHTERSEGTLDEIKLFVFSSAPSPTIKAGCAL